MSSNIEKGARWRWKDTGSVVTILETKQVGEHMFVTQFQYDSGGKCVTHRSFGAWARDLELVDVAT